MSGAILKSDIAVKLESEDMSTTSSIVQDTVNLQFLAMLHVATAVSFEYGAQCYMSVVMGLCPLR